MSELKGKTVKIGEGRIMFHYGEAEPTDTEYEIVFTIVQCKDCKYWTQQLGNYKGDAYGCCGRLTTRPYDFDMTANDFCSRGEMRTI